MLPKTYRLQVVNNTGVALAASDSITITAVRKNVSPSTALAVYEASAATLITGGASLASGAALNGATQDNTAAGTGWFEGDCYLTGTISTATPAGNLDVYLQFSPDGGTTWPAQGTGELVGLLYFTAVGTMTTDFSI